MTVNEFSAFAVENARRLFGFADPRYVRASLTAVVSGAAAAAAMLASVVTMPLLLHYLGAARFGVWMTLYSFVSMLGFLDFGVGFGLLTALAHSHGIGDRDLARRYVSSAAIVLLAIATILATFASIGIPLVPWAAIFNVNSPGLATEARNGVVALAGCLIVGVCANLPARVQAGYQKGYIASAWEFSARVAVLPAVLTAIHFKAGIPLITIVIVGLPPLAGLFNGLFLFTVQSPWLRPSSRYVDVVAAKMILQKGMFFFTVQLASAVAFASDNIVITQTLGPAAVGAYAVPATLYQIVSGVIYLFLVPLWPAYGEAFAQGHSAWITKTLRRSLFFSVAASTAGALVLTCFGKAIIAHWVGPDVHVSYGLLSGFAFWVILSSCGGAIAVLLNAASVLRFQVVIAVATALACITAKLVFAQWFGTTGVIWGTVGAYAVVNLVPCLIYVRRWL